MIIIKISDYTTCYDYLNKFDNMYIKLFNDLYSIPIRRTKYLNEIYKIHRRLRGEN